MFLSPLGERLGEGVQRERPFLYHPLTQPLPHKGERSMRGDHERAWRRALREGYFVSLSAAKRGSPWRSTNSRTERFLACCSLATMSVTYCGVVTGFWSTSR